jgi:hypothetical protein
MNFSYHFYTTLIASIITQFVVGAIEVGALFIQVVPKYMIIKQLLILEVIVQVIEASFYLWLAYNFAKVTNVTPKRYIDWCITTPTMLITLVVYLIYLNHKDKGVDTTKLELFEVLSENSTNLTYILCLNWLMLMFGYLGEQKIINTVTGVILGFIPFLLYYYSIYVNYAAQSETGWRLFLYFFFFWSLYGVAALFPYYMKNAFYNILDLFAKNFFGLFLTYLIITQKYEL